MCKDPPFSGLLQNAEWYQYNHMAAVSRLQKYPNTQRSVGITSGGVPTRNASHDAALLHMMQTGKSHQSNCKIIGGRKRLVHYQHHFL